MADQKKSATNAKREPSLSERDKPVKIDLDPGEALRALLAVDPDAPPVEPKTKRGKG